MILLPKIIFPWSSKVKQERFLRSLEFQFKSVPSCMTFYKYGISVCIIMHGFLKNVFSLYYLILSITDSTAIFNKPEYLIYSGQMLCKFDCDDDDDKQLPLLTYILAMVLNVSIKTSPDESDVKNLS